MSEPKELFSNEEMNVTLVLADHVSVMDNKLNVIGGGWKFTGSPTAPFGIGGIVEVPWNRANENHKFRLSLADLDGNAVEVDTGEGIQPVLLEFEFQVGRPPGHRPGASLSQPFAFNSGPLPLPPGCHFVWQFELNGREREDCRLTFSTRPEAQSAAA
jgi:hypothetical protein